MLSLGALVLLGLVGAGLADITGDNPAAGTCLCNTASSLNVRDAPCGDVSGTAPNGACFTYKGTKVGCSLSGTFYEWFENDFNGASGWMAGTYLIYGSTSDCAGPGTAPDPEFRALFLTTAWNVDWPLSSADSVTSQQSQMIDYLNRMQTMNMNSVVFQVRPAGDAFYDSSLEPWSRFLTGTQGTAPSPYWDPITYIVQEAHARSIEVHVWLNPYRANLSPNTDGLAPNHMCITMSQYCYVYGNYMWMDPGAQPVIDHLVAVITDIVTRYDVDGIHFDDYFYPYPDGAEFPDDSTYNAYIGGGGSMDRDDWRRDNVNRMVQSVYSEIHSLDASTRFSISPFGIYRPGQPGGMPSTISGLDPYSAMFADSKYWLSQGWVDFLAPQLYWAIDPPAQSYPVLLDWWLDNNPMGRHIYAANGVYKIDDSNNWPVSEIENQIGISRDPTRRSKLSLGNIFYSAKYFRDNTKGIYDTFRTDVYPTSAATPPMDWLAPRDRD